MIIIITIQDKFAFTKFPLHIKFNKELIIFVRGYCLDGRLQWLPSQYLILALNFSELSEVLIW